MMELPVAPPPDNPDQNAGDDANQPDEDNDNNAPAGSPNASLISL